MANRMMWTPQSLQRELKMVHMKVAIGASGAPTLNAAASNGVASISRTSAGLYRITLTDKWSSLVGIESHILYSSIEPVVKCQIKAETVSTTKLIDLWTLAATNSSTTTLAATDATNGATLYVTFYLKNTSV
jgi:hypothetical protein